MSTTESTTTPLRPKPPTRVPLRPKNTPSDHTSAKNPQSNPHKTILIHFANNKENHWDRAPPSPKTEASLASELSAVRQRLHRLRTDRDTTERMLRLRDGVLETRLQEFRLRGEFQKQIETEVDRLRRLQLQSVRLFRIGTLRERERRRRTQDPPLLSEISSGKEEAVDRNEKRTPNFRF